MNLTYENCITLLVLVDNEIKELKELAESNGPTKDYWVKKTEELKFIYAEIFTKACELEINPT